LTTEPVENTLLTDFAARLAAGDRDAAAALLAHAATIPGRGRTRRLMAAALYAGPRAGRLLQFFENVYVRLARRAA
jgi:hypothetical protein